MPGEIPQKTRSEWMRDEGRELYDEWMRTVLDYADEEPLAFDLEFITSVSNGESELTHVGIVQSFARAVRSRMRNIDDAMFKENVHPLLPRFNEIAEYTSVKEFMPGLQTEKMGLSAHNSESMEFAVHTTLGLAMIAEEKLAARNKTSLQAKQYGGLSKILKMPAFHRLVEDFSFTGFDVHGEKVSQRMLSTVPESLVMRKYLLSPDLPLFTVETNSDGSVYFELGKEVKAHLHSKVADQNKNGIMRLNDSEVWTRRATSGCPVRRPVPGQNESAIALLSSKLGDYVEQYLVEGLSLRTTGAAACKYAGVKAPDSDVWGF